MRPRLTSLQSRIIFFHLFAIILATVAVPLANYLVISRSTNLFEARTLEAHAAAIANNLHQDSPGHWRLDLPPDLNALYAHELEGLSYAVTSADGRILLSSGKDSDAGFLPRRNGLIDVTRNGAELFGVARQIHGPGGDVWIAVAQNAQHPDVIFDDIISNYLSRIGWFTVAILGLLLAVDIFVIRQALRPVIQASAIAGSIHPRRSDLRLPSAGMPSELLPLILAVNEALDRLETGIKLQREFTADAAHELRTPLAVLRARVDSLPDQNSVSALKSDIDVMGHVVSQLLEIAELEDSSIRFDERVDLQAVSADVVGMTAGMAILQRKEVALTGQADSVWVKGNGGMIFRAIRNLVDNAIRHTRTGTEVTVKVEADGTVEVMDRGPGVPVGERAMIFRRFWRGRHEGGEGAGLGLSIVSRIAELHGAKLRVSDRPGGGAVFALSFRLP